MSQLPPPAYTPSTARYNTLAVVSLISGLFSVFGHFVVPGIGGGTLALVAIVTGFIARSEIKRGGEQGMWMAVTGIVLGIIHWALLVLIFFGLIFALFVLGGVALFHH